MRCDVMGLTGRSKGLSRQHLAPVYQASHSMYTAGADKLAMIKAAGADSRLTDVRTAQSAASRSFQPALHPDPFSPNSLYNIISNNDLHPAHKIFKDTYIHSIRTDIYV